MVELTAGIFLLVAAVFDYRTMRIPNALQVIALLAIAVVIWVADPHSWKVRVAVSIALTILFLIFLLLRQTGGGDLKMMVWFGAGFGLHAVAILFLGSALMGVWTLGKTIARKKGKWMPLAPVLACGGLIWFLFLKFYVLQQG